MGEVGVEEKSAFTKDGLEPWGVRPSKDGKGFEANLPGASMDTGGGSIGYLSFDIRKFETMEEAEAAVKEGQAEKSGSE